MDAKANTHLCPSPFAPSETGDEPRPGPSAYMLVVTGGIPGTMIPLSEQGTTLGRSAESGFQIDDITVSRDHALSRWTATESFRSGTRGAPTARS